MSDGGGGEGGGGGPGGGQVAVVEMREAVLGDESSGGGGAAGNGGGGGGHAVSFEDVSADIEGVAQPNLARKTSGSGLFETEERATVIEALRQDSFRAQHAEGDTEAEAEAAHAAEAPEEKLGTLRGVGLPCLQNILGVILFLRLPFITSQAGTILTTVIIGLCVVSTVLTALSMSAIATNGAIAAGGPYYIISRNLGVEVGGAIGFLFYLGTSIAASMYILGAIESLQTGFALDGLFPFDVQVEALILALLLASIVSVGVKYVNMSASAFLAIVLVSVFCFTLGVILFGARAFTGDLDNGDHPASASENMTPDYEEDEDTGVTPNFFSLLAIFYPSVTGIMAGSNRSGVLKNPGKSIPVGTISAIVATTTIYVITVWLFGLLVANDALKDDKLIVASIAWPHKLLVNLGIIMSSIGAGLQSLTGAPRLLQAIANDDVIPFLRPFQSPTGTNPTRAVWLTYVVASLPCLAGNLDFITPIITMFFLVMYGSVNLSCFVLSVMRAPGFRPRWKYFHWSTALLGAIWCITLMLIISWIMAIVAFVLAISLLFYIRRHRSEKDWGDALTGLRFQYARDMLLAIRADAISHAKNWRPHLLVMTDLDEDGVPVEPNLVRFAGQMKKGRGLTMVLGLLEGDPTQEVGRATDATAELDHFLATEGVVGFSNVVLTNNSADGFFTAMQSIGIGALRPNTVMCAWPDNWADNMGAISPFVAKLKSVVTARKALVVIKGTSALPDSAERLSGTIDIWWIVHDGGLMLLLPYLLTLHKVWRGCTLRLFPVINRATDPQHFIDTERKAKQFLDNVRIDAEVDVVDLSGVQVTEQVYQQTMDLRTRRALVQGMGAPTMSVAVRDDDSGPGPNSTALSDMFAPLKAATERLEGDDDDDDDEDGKAETGLVQSKNASQNADTMTTTLPDMGRVRERAQSFQIDEQRMRTATALNDHMLRTSKNAHLVVTNLPIVRKVNPHDFMGYVAALTDQVEPCMLVRGSGREVVTTYG